MVSGNDWGIFIFIFCYETGVRGRGRDKMVKRDGVGGGVEVRG